MKSAELDKQTWGNWKLKVDSQEFVLRKIYHGRVRDLYRVDLERMETAAAMLDWIMQVSGKTFCNSQDIGDLVVALRELLDPQGHLCAWQMNAADARRRV